MMDNENKILSKIKNAPTNTYIIFYKNGCSCCDNSLLQLRDKKLCYKAYNVTKINDKHHINFQTILNILIKNKDELNFDPQHQTVPVIFYNGKFVGGNDELMKILNNH